MQKLSLLLLLLVLQLAMYGKGNKNRSLSQRPLSFLENKGQLFDQQGKPRTDIDFILHTREVTLFIGKGTLQYQFVKRDAPATSVDPSGQSPATALPITTYRLDVRLEGADRSAKIMTEDKRKEEFRYYTGNASPEGITDVHAYGKITYKNIYPGIDWVLYTKDGQLKYDFVVHPEGKIADIRMRYEGADKMSIEKDGSLIVMTPLGNVVEAAPYSYEQQGNREVQSQYRLEDNVISFVTDPYKDGLVIDPTVQWGSYFGGEGIENAGAVTTDTAGYVYICGFTNSTLGLATTGAYQQTFGGGLLGDAYLAKFDSTGQMHWATYYGGSGSGFLGGNDIGAAISCDRFGHVYIAGYTNSENGIATPGSFLETFTGDPMDFALNRMNGYLVQFNNEGFRQWASYYGGDHNVFFTGLACDTSGNVFVGGRVMEDTSGAASDEVVTPGAWQTDFGGGYTDALLVKFDSQGSRQWATYYGGEGADELSSVICDENGDVYIGGQTGSTAGIASANGYLQQVDPSSSNGFLAKFSRNDGNIDWSTFIHGVVNDLYIDPFNHLYIIGTKLVYATSDVVIDTTIVTPGCWQYTIPPSAGVSGSVISAFLMSFNPDNCTRNWGTFYSGSKQSDGHSVSGDASGHIFIAGVSGDDESNGIATPGSYQDTVFNADILGDPYIAQFDTSGMRKWGTFYGTTTAGHSSSVRIHCDFTGALYLSGTTDCTTHISTPGVYQEALNGSLDAFLVRWLPVDVGMERVMPGTDTVCTGDVPLTVQVNNNGRVDKVDDVVITYTYTGPLEGGNTFSFSGGLLAGVTETYDLGTLPLSVEGTYALTVYLHYTRDDHERGNDTLHFTLVMTTAEPVATIAYNQVGTNYQFSNPDGLSSYDYYWDFGDGATSTEATPTHAYAISGTYEVMLVVAGYCGTDTARLSLDAVGNGSGITEAAIDQLLVVFPNPVSGVLSIRSAALILKGYEVLNVLGQQVMTGSLSGATDKINVTGLAAGAYYIRIDTDKGVVEKPFQVVR